MIAIPIRLHADCRLFFEWRATTNTDDSFMCSSCPWLPLYFQMSFLLYSGPRHEKNSHSLSLSVEWEINEAVRGMNWEFMNCEQHNGHTRCQISQCDCGLACLLLLLPSRPFTTLIDSSFLSLNGSVGRTRGGNRRAIEKKRWVKEIKKGDGKTGGHPSGVFAYAW